MRRLTFALLAVLCLFTPSSILVAQSPPLTPFSGLIDHVSADQWGNASAAAEVWHRAISGDGRYVVFNSPSSNLSADDYEDYNGYDDIFLRDRMTGTTTRISRPFYGGAGDGISQMGTISTNGRHVAFASGSMNLVPGDTNDHWDVFVRDLDQQRTVRVSVATDGTQGDADSYYPSLSADGRFVAFISSATTFVPGVSPYGPRQMYVHDRDADGNGILDEPGNVTTELISAGLTGDIADQSVDSPRVTSDGRYVLFESSATNLDASGNLNGSNHLYRRDRQTGQTEMIDRAVTGGPSAWGVGYGTSDMTDDGRFITFSSVSHDIVTLDMNWQSQVFRYDTVAGPTATTIVSQLPDGTLGDGSSYSSSVSTDGRYVLFTTAASNLASPPPGESGPALLAVRDMLDGSFTRVDVLPFGDPFDESDYYYTPAISADGTAIVLHSRSTRALDGAYSYGGSHAFVLTALSASPTSATYPPAGGSGSIEVNTTAVSGWSVFSPWPWIVVTGGDGFGVGPRTVQYEVTDNGGVVREGWIRVGSTYVMIQQNSDGDTTPPILTPTVTGTQVNGWYTSDITVTWSVTDPDSEIVYQWCPTRTFTSDFTFNAASCEATSHGGTAYLSVPLRRDANPPTVTFAVPTQTIYSPGAVVTPFWSCHDGSGSGAQTCALTQGSSPLDTTPGRHTVTVTAMDAAGNSASKSVEYLVGSNVCVAPSVAPAEHLKAWVPLDGGADPWRDRVSGNFFGPMLAGGGFQTAVVGQGWVNSTTGNYLAGGRAADYTFAYDEGLTIAAWIKPFQGSFTGTILSNPMQYRVARFPDGTLRWAFNQAGIGFVWRNTGVVIPSDAWSHVAVTFKTGNVRTYLNGRLVSNAWVFDYLQITGDADAFLTIAGRAGASESLLGTIDDVLLFNEALTDADIESIALAGGGSLCVPATSNITLTAPSNVAFGATFPVTALLTDGAGTPLPNRQIEIGSRVGPTGYLYQFNAVTNANGTATVQLPVSSSATIGHYPNAIKAYFPGDVSHQSSQIVQGATLVAGTPAVTWPSPAAIVYGAALAGTQLNATASLAGTFTYSPAAGTVLNAGTQTLSVTFTPSDTTYWTETTKTTTLVVNKATPTVTAAGGTFTYDNQSHAGSGAAVGVLGEALTPVTLTYDGASSTAPTTAGNHTVRASYAGSANYLAGQSADATLTISRATPAVDFDTTTVWYTGYPRTPLVFIRGIGGVELNPYTVLYNGTTTAPTNAGTYALEVQFAGNTNYEPVTATGSFVIRKNLPIFPTLNNIGYTYDGQPHGINVVIIGVQNEHLTPVITTYSGSTTMPVNAGVYTVVVGYDGSANYEAASRTFTLTIFKKAPQLTWGIAAYLTYGQPLGAEQLDATANVPGTFTYMPPAGTILPAGSPLLTATFTPADTTNYQVVNATQYVTVLKANPQLAWAYPGDIVYGTPLTVTQLAATANTPGTFVYTPPAGTVLAAGQRFLSVAFTPDDLANYNTGANRGWWINVTKAMPVVSWNAPADVVYGTALGAAQLNATANVPGTFSYSPAAGTVLGAGPRTLSVTFTPADAANYSSTTSSVTLNVAKAASSINWSNPADIVYGTALGGSQLNATATVPGTFSYSPAAGAVLGAGTRTLSATFTPSDAANYNGSTASVILNVAKAGTTLIWSPVAALTYGTPLGVAQLNAFAVGVDGTFSYSPPAGTVLTSGIHTLSVTFTPNDPANYNGASATVLTEVFRAASTISWPSPAALVYGTALGGSQLNATANVPGTFTYSPAIGTVLNAGWHTLSVTFTPDDAVNYVDATKSVALNVTRAPSTITWSNPADIIHGTALGASQLNATANVAGTFSYSPAAGAVLNAGSQTLSVTFTPDDPANYTGGSANVTLTVTKAATTVSWSNPGGIVYGTALGAAQLNATANVPGTFSYSPAAGTVLGAGSQTLAVTFTPDDAANYSGSSANVSLTVTKATSTINWANPADIVYGTALGAAQLNATANVPGTFSYSPAAGTVLGAGSQTLAVTFTPDDAANYSGSLANVTLNVTKAPTTVSWSNPAGIVYGTALGAAQLNATANVAGTFSYSPAAGTVLGAGTHNLSVTFTPADGANYATAGAAASIVIAPAGLTVQANDAGKVYGQALPAFTASGTGFVNGDSMASLGGTLAFATAATATSAPGSYSVAPNGVSSANYAITFAAGTLTVNQATTSLTLTTTPNPSNNNQTVQLRAVVTAVAPGAGTATGTVQFRENGTVLGTATLVNGVATMSKSFKRGTHPLTATYAGSTNFTGSAGSVTHSTQ